MENKSASDPSRHHSYLPALMKGEIRTFLELLFGEKPSDLYILVWTLQDKRSRWFRNVDGAAAYVESLSGCDVYVGVGLSAKDFGAKQRCTSEKIASIPGFWADIDLKSDAHHKSALPITVEEALSILPEGLSPSIIVLTGNGIHVYWLFKEPLIFTSDEDRCNAANLALRLQSLLRLKAAARGWAFDRLADLARVLRVPGTQNCKDPTNPKPVRIDLQSDHRYNPTDFKEFLDKQHVPDPEEQVQTARELKDKLSDKPLAIDPSARFQKISSVITWTQTRDFKRRGCDNVRT